MSKKIAIIQSNYIPWKGYFDIIRSVDEFVLYDDMQYTRRDWRNRNVIKTPNGLQWLTIPVEVKGKYYQTIKETRIADKDWNIRHWQIIRQNYANASGFKVYAEIIENLYVNCNFDYLSDVNYYFLTNLCSLLGINTKFRWSSEFLLEEDRTIRLISICKQCNAETYVSGPAAKSYMDEPLFTEEGIKLEYFDYNNYVEYNQITKPFNHYVSIIDLLFNTGTSANEFLNKQYILSEYDK